MAEDEAGENDLIAAIKRVHEMRWPAIRHRVLWRALKLIAELLHLEIVEVVPPATLDSEIETKPPTQEKDNGNE